MTNCHITNCSDFWEIDKGNVLRRVSRLRSSNTSALSMLLIIPFTYILKWQKLQIFQSSLIKKKKKNTNYKCLMIKNISIFASSILPVRTSCNEDSWSVLKVHEETRVVPPGCGHGSRFGPLARGQVQQEGGGKAVCAGVVVAAWGKRHLFSTRVELKKKTELKCVLMT